MPYIDDDNVKEAIEKDVEHINYSLALSDVLEEIDNIIKKEEKKREREDAK